MISLAGRDIMHSWGKFVFTGIGLGLLIGVTLSMAGIFRGMVDDAKALLDNSGGDLWVVQKNTLGPYAEPSSIYDDAWQSIRGISGVDKAASVTYLTMQIKSDKGEVRAMVTGIAPGGPQTPGWPTFLVAGRQITRGHYEAIADVVTGFKIGERIKIRRNLYTVVGLTRRMVSSSGDPLIYISLKDAQEAQFLKDNEAILEFRRRNASEGAQENSFEGYSQSSNPYVNAVLVKVKPGYDANIVAESIRRWVHLTVYTRVQMEDILVGKLIASSAKQIAMFLVILTIVSAITIAFIIYTLTMGKIREIAVLKLIGTKNRSIVAMIMQQTIALGLIGFTVGKIVASLLMVPIFPKYVLLTPIDTAIGFFAVVFICIISSIVAIQAAFKIDPAEAIGG